MYRKNVAGQFLYFAMVTTAGAADTGATVTVKRCIDGGAQASGGGTVTHRGGGQYEYALAQADTNGNNISLFFTATGDVPVEKTIVTTAADPTDAVRFGLTALPNANAEAAGGLYTRGSGAGQIAQSNNGRVDTDVKSIANAAIAAATFAANALDAVWSTATRALTDKAGFALSAAGVQAIWDALTSALTTAGSIGKLLVDNINATISSRLASASYTAPLDAAGTRAAVGLAAANLDTQLAAAPNATADALLDRTNGVETSWTVRQALRIMFSVLGGKLDGAATTTIHTRDQADTKNRMTATVDSNGNRTAVTLDAS